MADYIIDGAILTDIADTLRAQSGSTEPIVPEKMAEEAAAGYDRGYTAGHSVGYKIGFSDGSISFDAFVENQPYAVTGNAKSIPASKFYNSQYVTAVILPEVTSIGGSAFRGCTNLEFVDLAKSVTLATSAFRSCPKLYTLILRTNKVQNLPNDNIFADTPIADGTGTIYVHDDFVDQYKASSWATTYAAPIKPLRELEGDA